MGRGLLPILSSIVSALSLWPPNSNRTFLRLSIRIVFVESPVRRSHQFPGAGVDYFQPMSARVTLPNSSSWSDGCLEALLFFQGVRVDVEDDSKIRGFFECWPQGWHQFFKIGIRRDPTKFESHVSALRVIGMLRLFWLLVVILTSCDYFDLSWWLWWSWLVVIVLKVKEHWLRNAGRQWKE